MALPKEIQDEKKRLEETLKRRGQTVPTFPNPPTPSTPPTSSNLPYQIQDEKERLEETLAKRNETFLDKARDVAEGAAEFGIDAGVAALDSATFHASDEVAGGIAAAYQKATGDERPISDIYTEARDSVRKFIKGSYDRSPVGSFIGNMAGYIPGAATAPVKLGILMGIMQTDEKGINLETGINVGAGAVGGQLGKYFTRAGKNITDPAKVGTKLLKKESARSIKKGSEAVKKLTENMKYVIDGGFITPGGEYSLRTLKYVKSGKDKLKQALKLEPIGELTLEGIEKKMQTALTKNNKRLSEIIKKYKFDSRDLFSDLMEFRRRVVDEEVLQTGSKKVDDEIFDTIRDTLNISENDLVNYFGRLTKKQRKQIRTTTDFLEHVDKKIKDAEFFDDERVFPLELVQRQKQKLQKMLSDDYGKETVDSQTVQIRKELAQFLREFIDNYAGKPVRVGNEIKIIPNKEVLRLNKSSSSLMEFFPELQGGIQRGPFESAGKIRAGGIAFGQRHVEAGMIDQITESIAGDSRPLRALIGQKLQNNPNLAKYLENLLTTAPIKGATYFDATAEGDADSDAMGRTPQSLEAEQQLMQTPLPRNSEAILNNEALFIEKLRLMGGDVGIEQAQPIIEAINRNPRVLPEVIPPLVMMMPSLFQFDKYNRFDGRILTPEGKEMARRDTENDPKLKESEKTVIIDRINRTGEFDAPYIEETVQ